MLSRAHPHPFPATRRLTLVVTVLLLSHAFLAWFALQAVFVFVEMMWRVLAGRDELRPLLATHVGQLPVLRGLWNASDPRHPADGAWRQAPTPARVFWWWVLLVAAVAADASARGL